MDKKVLGKLKEQVKSRENSDGTCVPEKLYTENLYVLLADRNQVYSSEQLVGLKDYCIPYAICSIWNEIGIIDRLYIGADVYLISPEDFINENSEYAPGAYIIKYGYLVFATTIGGNALCVKLGENDDDPVVYIADRSIFCSTDIVICKEGTINIYSISQSVVDQNIIRISESLSHFINSIISGEIKNAEDYL